LVVGGGTGGNLKPWEGGFGSTGPGVERLAALGLGSKEKVGGLGVADVCNTGLPGVACVGVGCGWKEKVGAGASLAVGVVDAGTLGFDAARGSDMMEDGWDDGGTFRGWNGVDEAVLGGSAHANVISDDVQVIDKTRVKAI
jgi:hypothetical protein